jgi:hypothetical protein
MPTSGAMPPELDTYLLLRVGLSYADTEEIPGDKAQAILAIDRIFREAQNKEGS